VAHTGFLIPNAKDVASTVLAEPDKIDFNTIANARWGVVEGCAVTPQGGNLIAVSAGTAVVNGKLVTVSAKPNVPVSVPNSQFRFDLICVNDAGTVQVEPGQTLDDPVFPDPQPNQTVLAAVYCSSTSSDYSSNIIDKRKFLSASLFAKMPVGDELIRNLNATGNHYRVTGGGTTTWEDDTTLRRSSAETLEVGNDFRVLRNLYVGKDIRGLGGIKVDGYVDAQNLQRGNSVPLTGTPGDIFQHTTTGRLWLWVGPAAGGAWQELSTSASSVPVGTIIMSMAPPATLAPFGWVPMDGSKIYEDKYPGLFALPALAGNIIAGPAPRAMNMPNMQQRFPFIDHTRPNKTGGKTDSTVTLSVTHLPSHKHNIGGGGTTAKTGTYAGFTPIVNIASSGDHEHTLTAGGKHAHRIQDPKHRHIAADDTTGTGRQIIACHPDGTNKLDALFNDGSHTWSVMPYTWTMPHETNITILQDLSEHSHEVTGGAHTHIAGIAGNQGSHYHDISESAVGDGTAFSVQPAYFACYAYIKG
jgi:microcystin-dependent protein